MAKGRKTGGRQRGTPNRVTLERREIVNRALDGLAPDVEEWIRAAARGEVREKPDGGLVVIREPDPGKAAQLFATLAEYGMPKLARVEKGIPDASDEELLQELRRRRAEAEGKAK